ncbi:hypothetical protein [Mesorhizobium sp. IMUNJ 23232]|uniref:hypothetical protein n=1 Tax=Mesorhizobium sp. IMUNJ 23232 TaxID=3376064 RepID=UPI0037956536
MTITLCLTIPGVPEASIQAGLQAAADHFNAVGVHPVTAENAVRMLDGLDLEKLADDEWAKDELDAAQAWNDAEISAFVAALGVGSDIPKGSKLTVVHPPFSEKRKSLVDFVISVAGASQEELRRGVEAALEVFVREGISPEQAADGQWAVESWDDAGFPDDEAPSEELEHGCSVWNEASAAAFQAVFPDWRETKRSGGANLALLLEPEIQLATRSRALAMMRELVDRTVPEDSNLFGLACAVASSIENGFRQQELAKSVTAPYNALYGPALNDPEKVDAAVRGVFAAIDALEAATSDSPDQLPVMSSAHLFEGKETRPWTGVKD